MNAMRILIVSSVAALATACANPGATSAEPGSPGMAHMDRGSAGSMAAMDPRMKTLHEMHQKMKNAKTPAERQALMADHMTAMQDGMAMMKDMHGKHGGSAMAGMGEGKGMPDDKAKHHRMMADHLATMQMMMDMMADRMPPAAANQ